MRLWLPLLVGIEHQLELRIGAGPDAVVVPSTPDEEHQEQLTREDITSAVHYLRFEVGTQHHDAFLRGPVELVVTHPAYREQVELSDGLRRELATDLASA